MMEEGLFDGNNAYRNEKRKIYYLDKTWGNLGHTTKARVDETVASPRTAFRDGLSTLVFNEW